MEITRKNLPREWDERWRKEKERRKRVIEEGGEKFEEENRKLKWIMSYNDSRIGMKERAVKDSECDNMEVDELLQRYHRQSYPSEIFQTLVEMKMENILTDLILSTEDGMSFHVHSLVLAAVSSLIQQKLQERDGDEKEISLRLCPEVHGSGLAAVVEFAYTGAISNLNKDGMPQIQTAACSLGAPRVLEITKDQEDGGNREEKLRKISAEEQLKVGLQSMKDLWAKRVGCDIELVAEGTVFQAHRVLLAASSDYFRGMFTSGMKESRQESVSLLLVGAGELEPLLNWAYSGTLMLGWGCVFDLASTSLQLQIQPAISFCLEFLEQEMDVLNCLDVASFAEAYGMTGLMELAEDFILRHFQEVSATPKFRDLPAEKLLAFLRCDALSTPSELAVFRAVVTWVEADPNERLPQAEELMQAVRFSFMTFREFREVRAVNLRMECSGEFEVELYKSALEEFGIGISDRAQPRVRHPKDALVLVGGDQLNPDMDQRLPSRQLWFVNSLRSGIGLVKEIEWRMLGEMPDRARFRHGVGVHDGQLYVAGGCHFYTKYDVMKSVYRYDPMRDHWKRLADLLELRSNFTLVVSGDALYAVGGDKDIHTNLDSVEKNSLETDSWSFTHPLDQALSGHAAAVWGGEIFISGGFNCKYQCLPSMFLYHPVRGTTYLADMTHDRAQHCMESMRNHFYVAGGVCNLNTYYTNQLVCEMYDPVHDTWTVFTPLPVPHVGAASAVLEERLYILGGYCREDYTEARRTDRYDPVTQRWDSMGKIPGPVTDVCACLLHLPEHIRK
ncbi:kelch-like protein 33 [Pimephales promelas]|uniref:kelch-like protein 33 n=1 Tax=Pimephales promelas TaxID=90988 RepID=UPI00195587CA|nr:kelch-like protein 33 [Pimephales promelas]KAG1937888.1 kelch-like protein [Pimephales promelas]